MRAFTRSLRIRPWSALFAGALLLAMPLPAADHLDAPSLSSPGFDGRMDINDVYAFQSPADPANTVLIMTLDPVASVLSPLVFNPLAVYELLVDTNGDAKEDLTFSARFNRPMADGSQRGTLRCSPARNCPAPNLLAVGRTGRVLEVASGGSFQFGLFDDPFFFDLAAFLGAYDFCNAPGGTPGSSGSDFFAGLNTMAIVLEVPSHIFGRPQIGVWARTVLLDKRGAEQGRQIDRMGRPAINTVFIPSQQKNAFNESQPITDRARFGKFLGEFAGALLPDILTVDVSTPQGFLNGRRLDDDVIDIELQLITGSSSAGDCVDASDNPFSDTFPYLAGPNASTIASSSSQSTTSNADLGSTGAGSSQGSTGASAATEPRAGTPGRITTSSSRGGSSRAGTGSGALRRSQN